MRCYLSGGGVGGEGSGGFSATWYRTQLVFEKSARFFDVKTGSAPSPVLVSICRWEGGISMSPIWDVFGFLLLVDRLRCSRAGKDASEKERKRVLVCRGSVIPRRGKE